MQLFDLEKADRLRLMRFVCSFAWADLEVQDAEKTFVGKMIRELDLDEDERGQVDAWLKRPPPPEDVDPTDIPKEHRQIFLNAALQLVGADGVVDEHEMETLSIFEQLLR
jgi:uncharacterized membrane protein YebE (DUF533 family)